MCSPQVSDAFSALGLDKDATLESVRTAYKQIALRIHPDKNLDNPDATAEFQRVSESYRILVKHFEHPEPHYHDHHHHGDSGHPFFSFFPQGGYYPEDEDEYDDYGYDSYEDDDEIAFFMHLFFNATKGQQYSRSAHRTQRKADDETPEQYKERVRLSREEQIASEERRKREAAFRKERLAQEKEEERTQAEQRQKDKIQAKKAQAEAARKAATDKAKEIKRKSQLARSAVFAAARSGNADKVKKGVWEDSVDASGGEITAGGAEYIQVHPANSRETLLHIAARLGDVDLVKWLDSHGADSEERDCRELTAFQVALKKGHVAIVKFFVETYPPKDSDFEAIYTSPTETSSLLSMAVESREPEHVFIVLENKLASEEDIKKSWNFVSSAKGQEKLKGPNPTATINERVDDIIKLLSRYTGFLHPPPPPPAPHVHQAHLARESRVPPTQGQRDGHPTQRGGFRGKPNTYRGRGRGKFRGNSRPEA